MYKYTVIGNQKLTPSVLLLTLKRDPKTKPFLFKPGQYTAISFKRNGRPTPVRCFSIVNSPTDRDMIQCSIRKKGRFTEALTELNPGDKVKVVGAFGGFIFDYEYDNDIVLIAGGIGIAPFMSMIQYATNTNLSNRITLIYGVKNQNDVPFFEQLKELEKINQRFKMSFAVGSGSVDRFTGSKVHIGRITPDIINQVVRGSYINRKFFICGPSQFMQVMTKSLRDKGVYDDDIMTEDFGQGKNPQSVGRRNLPSNIYKIGAVGLVLASLTVMIGDLVANLPVFSASQPTTKVNPLGSSSQRQDDLDELIKSGPNQNNTSTNTNANASNTSNQTTTTTNPTTAPKCTTTQSGVTTCV